jgi:hypothetical protein
VLDVARVGLGLLEADHVRAALLDEPSRPFFRAARTPLTFQETILTWNSHEDGAKGVPADPRVCPVAWRAATRPAPTNRRARGGAWSHDTGERDLTLDGLRVSFAGENQGRIGTKTFCDGPHGANPGPEKKAHSEARG